jgi:hypothetical protein
MKTTTLAVALSAVMGLSVSSVSFAFGLPKIPGIGASSNSNAQAVDVEGFMVKAAETNAMFQQSALLLTTFLGDKSKVAALDTELKAIEAISDVKERSAKMKALAEQNKAVIEASLSDKTKAQEELGKLQAEQRSRAIAAAFNFALGVMQAKELVPAGQSAMTSLQSNPMQATKLLGIKNTVSDLTGIVGNTTLALTTVPSLFKAAKIDAPIPTSSSDKPASFN